VKPAPFEYRAPNSLDEALEILQEHGDEAKLLAGGQSLVPAMNFRVVQPSMLIDLNRVEELAYLRAGDGAVASTSLPALPDRAGGAGLQIGAMTRERQLEFDPLVPLHFPLLAEAIGWVAHPQIRNRGTLGGSLANADPAAELPVIMVALDARFKIRSASAERWVPAREFFLGMFATDLAPDEMLVEVELPAQPPRTGWSFMEVAPRHGDYALMGVAARVTLSEDEHVQSARLVFLNAGDGPVDAQRAVEMLEGQAPGDDLFAQAAQTASQEEISPLGNIHASPEFQRHLADVLTRRALKQAADRAAAEGPREGKAAQP
jgi:CO/xanthine dehydrogenase FAD-binding subunit